MELRELAHVFRITPRTIPPPPRFRIEPAEGRYPVGLGRDPLGVETWTLLRKNADWRWMDDRRDTPWYPAMRLFRQRVDGDWDAVLDDLLRERAQQIAS